MNRFVRILLGIFLVFLMGFIDYLTGSDLSFSIFYLIPIFILSWYSGKTDGTIIVLVGSVVWLGANVMGGDTKSVNAVIVWNTFVRFGIFILSVQLVNKLKKMHVGLEAEVAERTADLLAEINEREKAENELKNITEKLRKLTKRVQIIREEENKIIAREIHDELGQALTAIKIDIAWIGKKFSNNESVVESLHTISGTIDDTIKTVRKISTRLRPRLLDELGLFPAIEWQVKEFQNRTGVNCSLILPDDNIEINSTFSSAIFRIFQEAITNITRHSFAKNVYVEIISDNGSFLTMTIKDNGIGLPENYLYKEQSLGILGMQERAYSIGGSVDIKSTQGKGTEVLLKVPLHKIKTT